MCIKSNYSKLSEVPTARSKEGAIKGLKPHLRALSKNDRKIGETGGEAENVLT